ncbi:uncharacterized protein LOC133424840 [Cololabis saira]|uniref:uncharacterized protein LOC133424840 n=1 Tax=Cololabis saira TaxID=129043 RepID=UPI002AD31199|nr:uncharacterized protein LOC133424840 [Cololabis saira]
MACTSLSAVEYVKKARVLLVGGLRSLSVIVENLYQLRVLSDEEVSKINAEKDNYDKTRKILDLVTSKGEAATYEFIKIIDITRKRTLPPLLSKNKPDSSSETEKSVLHQWISSFPFKADRLADEKYFKGAKPCHKYQGKLKEKAQKTSNRFWSGNKDVFGGNNKPDLSYMSLVLDKEECEEPSKIKRFKSKKSKMCRPKKLKTYIPENKGEMSPGVLLKTHKNVLLVGKPGIGKTALICEMLRLWAESENEELDYMFYFDMREVTQMKIMTLEDLLFNAYIKPDEGKDEVLQDIERISDNVTVMLDGVTDLSSPVLKKLLEGDLLPGAKIIIACRPDDEEDTCLDDPLRVEVKGFSEQAIKAYLSATLADEHKTVLSNVELLTLCHVPMYALMVAASFSSGVSPQPRTVTEVYINIVRFCLQRNSNKPSSKHLNNFIQTKSEGILSLAKVAFLATRRKTVNLEEVSSGDSCVLSFLKPLIVRVSPTKTLVKYAFLHYTVQEFFAALWLLKNPDQIKNIFQQRPIDEMKHMTHLIPFMCQLLNEENPSLISCLIPAQELQNTRTWFFKEIIASFFSDDILFLCQCLYESQLPEACIDLLDKLDYCLDLSDQNLDPYHCCAVAYVISQSKEKKIQLQLEDVIVSEQGMEQLLRCHENVHWCEPLSQQLWKIFLQSDWQMDPARLLSLDGNQLHLPVPAERRLFGRAVEVINKMSAKVKVCLYQDETAAVCQSLWESLFQALPNISSLSFDRQRSDHHEGIRFLGNLFCAAAEREQQTGEKILQQLSSVCRHETFPFNKIYVDEKHQCDILLDLYTHMKDYETQTGFRVLPSLRSVFQSAPAVWIINLSDRKTSILLEVLKLQSEKKPVELTGCSHEDGEVRSFLQSLPYISQLRRWDRKQLCNIEQTQQSESNKRKRQKTWKVLDPDGSDLRGGIRFLGNLFCAAAEREQQTGEKILQQLSSVCRHKSFPFNERYMAEEYQCDVLLDLYTHMKDCETQTGFRVLPSFQSVFQSAPAVWIINLSERKTSILLEVLKLQSEKKPVELTGWTDEDGEVRSFLQCLPYISQLSLDVDESDHRGVIRILGILFCAAAEREQQTGEEILQQLSSVCRYKSFPFNEGDMYDKDQCDVLLDLYTHMKNCETQTGFRVLPSLRSVFQSVPAVWIINLSERKTSILLEVLKLQSEKKPVKLTGCSHEDGEVRSFLQSLPYISQLSLDRWRSDLLEGIRILGNLFCAAAEREQQTGEKILQQLSSVCTHKSFPFNEGYKDQCDVLLDLYTHMKDCETQTGFRVLPSLRSVFQSAPAVWIINLSERKTSILLEVLKLQSEKKPVELTVCSHEDGEVRSFLQCLPYISQLNLDPLWSDHHEGIRFLGNLFCAAAEREQQTGEKILQQLSSVCRHKSFPLNEGYKDQCDVLLDLYTHMKDYETKTGFRVLPSLRSVFQSVPAVWIINLSERKTSILLEVLKLQSEKKPVELTGWTHEDGEVRSFLQCLPYISRLSLDPDESDHYGIIRILGNLFCAAAAREQQTGEKIMQQLSSVCRYKTFPFNESVDDYDYEDDYMYQCDFLLDLCTHMKDCETQTGFRVLPSLRSVFQSVPAVWIINLSERKSSILLEVLKLQSEKKPVKLTGCSHEDGEVRSFLQCLPYISQLRLDPPWSDLHEGIRFLGNLFCAAAEREQQTGEKILQQLSSVCRYETFPFSEEYMDEKDQCDVLLDLYTHMKDCETQTGFRVLPSLRSVFQSVPAVWIINLSERKTSILLEVLKLQSEKKPVKLTGCSHEDGEVRSFLQCLPYISQLSLDLKRSDLHEGIRFLGNLFCAAAEREQQTGEKILQQLSSVCRHETFPFNEGYKDEKHQCDVLLDLYTHMKDCETQTGFRVLPSLQSVFQSVPAVWIINLSERKISILLEVLKLQSEKKPVKLTGCSHEEGEVRSFLQCLPYISQLSLDPDESDLHEGIRFLGNLFCAAAEREQQTGEKILQQLSSVCRHETFPFNEGDMDQCDVLLDLYTHMKDSEAQTGFRVLPSLRLDLKKSDFPEGIRFLGNLFCAAAEREQQTGEKILQQLSSVCRYETFPFNEGYMDQCDVLLDLYTHMKDCETQTGFRVLPSFQSVFQSAPAVWIINLSERKTSILLEVLKLQSEKKPVELAGCSHEDGYKDEKHQCDVLLDLYTHIKDYETQTGFRVLPSFQSVFQSVPAVWIINLSERKTSILLEVLKLQSEKKPVELTGCSHEDAAEREQQTGEKILQQLSSVCRHETFLFNEGYKDDKHQCDFLLDLYTHMKNCETQTGFRVLPSFQSVFQSVPEVWIINLSKRKTSILLEVLKLQSEKKPVKLKGCSHEDGEVRSFLQCLPYISQLR